MEQGAKIETNKAVGMKVNVVLQLEGQNHFIIPQITEKLAVSQLVINYRST